MEVVKYSGFVTPLTPESHELAQIDVMTNMEKTRFKNQSLHIIPHGVRTGIVKTGILKIRIVQTGIAHAGIAKTLAGGILAGILALRGDFMRSIAVSAMLMLLLAGCLAKSAPDQKALKQGFSGQEIELLAPKSLNLPTFWEVLLQEWSSQTGASLKFVEFAENPENAAVPAQAEREAGSGGRLILFPLNQLCELEPQLSPLPISDLQLDSRDIFKGLRERVLTRDRQLVAFPLSAPVLVCYYRQDLLRTARGKAPETWDEYQELVDSLEKWAPGLVAVEPLGAEFRATTFFARSLAYCKHPENYSVWFDIDTVKPTLTTAGFIEGLERAQQTWAKLPAAVATYSPADCRQLVLSGKAALAIGWEPQSADLVSRSTSNEGSPPPQRIEGIQLGICRLPGSRRVFNRNSKKWDTLPAGTVHSPALCGFSGMAAGVILPRQNGGDAAAANLLISLTSTALFNEAFSALPKGPCRESQISIASNWFGPELSTEESSQYTDAVAQSLRDPQLVAQLPLLGAEEFRQAASMALEPLLKGEADPQQTAAAMQKSFEAIIERLGTDAIRDSHRRGLGLAPLPKK
jgi:ABC-type glycerol-3-phosphate transport system substrate-binding protein